MTASHALGSPAISSSGHLKACLLTYMLLALARSTSRLDGQRHQYRLLVGECEEYFKSFATAQMQASISQPRSFCL